MNYVIINGMNSKDINGLHITELPPITKPAKRVIVETIAGRDGDIVTELGFEAYNKTIEIALTVGYDVDQVIEFFNRSGIVTFSNERDKYYNFNLFEQINFEKLFTAKTAKVTMHVQPYKYSLTDKSKKIKINNQLLIYPQDDFSEDKNGVNVRVANNSIVVNGTSTELTEFLIPVQIKDGRLEKGDYKLNAYASGFNPHSCMLKLVRDTKNNAFGGNNLALVGGRTVEIQSHIDEPTSFNYIFLYISGGMTMNFTIDTRLYNVDTQTFKIMNYGNANSKPTMIIYGQGTVNVRSFYMHNLKIELDREKEITIDTLEMEAYKYEIHPAGMRKTLKNRLVAGNYEKFQLYPGSNDFEVSGQVSEIVLSHCSRWY